ncbi:hypothetical protein SADUNF_Sadunf03G0144700 [Salix dunnii]|uniref:Uncharacterized protein n=1 Tax=Salix dunnii TaxID=1413687 RepID=A0A835N4U6_9ROSI|nr:hypothetical protein SADUNF_Sadunf03G0144700 [Salix dunnii]
MVSETRGTKKFSVPLFFTYPVVQPDNLVIVLTHLLDPAHNHILNDYVQKIVFNRTKPVEFPLKRSRRAVGSSPFAEVLCQLMCEFPGRQAVVPFNGTRNFCACRTVKLVNTFVDILRCQFLEQSAVVFLQINSVSSADQHLRIKIKWNKFSLPSFFSYPVLQPDNLVIVLTHLLDPTHNHILCPTPLFFNYPVVQPDNLVIVLTNLPDPVHNHLLFVVNRCSSIRWSLALFPPVVLTCDIKSGRPWYHLTGPELWAHAGQCQFLEQSALLAIIQSTPVSIADQQFRISMKWNIRSQTSHELKDDGSTMCSETAAILGQAELMMEYCVVMCWDQSVKYLELSSLVFEGLPFDSWTFPCSSSSFERSRSPPFLPPSRNIFISLLVVFLTTTSRSFSSSLIPFHLLDTLPAGTSEVPFLPNFFSEICAIFRWSLATSSVVLACDIRAIRPWYHLMVSETSAHAGQQMSQVLKDDSHFSSMSSSRPPCSSASLPESAALGLFGIPSCLAAMLSELRPTIFSAQRLAGSVSVLGVGLLLPPLASAARDLPVSSPELM